MDYVQLYRADGTGAGGGGQGGTALSPNFGRLVTLTQDVEVDYVLHISTCPPDIQTFRHPCCKNIFQREDSSSLLYPVHNEQLLFLQRSYFNERKQPAKIGNKTNYYNTLFKNLELFLGWMDSPWMG